MENCEGPYGMECKGPYGKERASYQVNSSVIRFICKYLQIF
jgi:hypothetical protein